MAFSYPPKTSRPKWPGTRIDTDGTRIYDPRPATIVTVPPEAPKALPQYPLPGSPGSLGQDDLVTVEETPSDDILDLSPVPSPSPPTPPRPSARRLELDDTDDDDHGDEGEESEESEESGEGDEDDEDAEGDQVETIAPILHPHPGFSIPPFNTLRESDYDSSEHPFHAAMLFLLGKSDFLEAVCPILFEYMRDGPARCDSYVQIITLFATFVTTYGWTANLHVIRGHATIGDEEDLSLIEAHEYAENEPKDPETERRLNVLLDMYDDQFDELNCVIHMPSRSRIDAVHTLEHLLGFNSRILMYTEKLPDSRRFSRRWFAELFRSTNAVLAIACDRAAMYEEKPEEDKEDAEEAEGEAEEEEEEEEEGEADEENDDDEEDDEDDDNNMDEDEEDDHENDDGDEDDDSSEGEGEDN